MTTLKYCEGCENEKLPLGPNGFCPLCTRTACGGADAAAVGLTAAVHITAAMEAIHDHKDLVHIDFDENCFFCQVIAGDVECPECGRDMTGAGNHPGGNYGCGDEDGHVICCWTVLVGCEGFHTTAVRYASQVKSGLV